MAILIGVDEAGYGPNYGPLAIAATAWQVEEERGEIEGWRSEAAPRGGASSPSEPDEFDLYQLLQQAVVRSPQECRRRIAVADSKQLYKPGHGLRQLERGVLAALRAAKPRDGVAVRCVAQLLAATAADPDDRRQEIDCHYDDQLPLPVDSTAGEIEESAAMLWQACEASGVELLAVRARLVFPEEFNELVDCHGTKGAALSHTTLALVREVVDAALGGAATAAARAGGGDASARGPSVFVTLDKHGGRNRYGSLLQHWFPESWVEAIGERRAASRYRWVYRGASIEALFRVGGEERLPTALASMTAKYQRELAMRAFNHFWTSRLPGLKPTAGYPVDARRFKADIAPLQRELGIDDRAIWRSR